MLYFFRPKGNDSVKGSKYPKIRAYLLVIVLITCILHVVDLSIIIIVIIIGYCKI